MVTTFWRTLAQNIDLEYARPKPWEESGLAGMLTDYVMLVGRPIKSKFIFLPDFISGQPKLLGLSIRTLQLPAL